MTARDDETPREAFERWRAEAIRRGIPESFLPTWEEHLELIARGRPSLESLVDGLTGEGTEANETAALLAPWALRPPEPQAAPVSDESAAHAGGRRLKRHPTFALREAARIVENGTGRGRQPIANAVTAKTHEMLGAPLRDPDSKPDSRSWCFTKDDVEDMQKAIANRLVRWSPGHGYEWRKTGRGSFSPLPQSQWAAIPRAD